MRVTVTPEQIRSAFEAVKDDPLAPLLATPPAALAAVSLTRAELRSAMLMIAQCGVISVVARPVEGVAERGHQTQHEQGWPEPTHFGDKGILQRGEARAGDDKSPHAGTHGDGHDDGPDDESPGED